MLDFAESVEQWFSQIVPQSKTVLTAMLIHNHWIPFVFEKSTDSWNVITTQDGKNIWSQLRFPDNHDLFEVPIQHGIFPEDCGFQTVDWFNAVVSTETPQGMDIHKADEWRQCYWQKMYMDDKSVVGKPFFWGSQ